VIEKLNQVHFRQNSDLNQQQKARLHINDNVSFFHRQSPTTTLAVEAFPLIAMGRNRSASLKMNQL